MSGKSCVTLSLAKEFIYGGSDASFCSGLDLEGQCSALCFTTEDRKEEVAAFMEKRKPEPRGSRKLSPMISATIQYNYWRGGPLQWKSREFL